MLICLAAMAFGSFLAEGAASTANNCHGDDTTVVSGSIPARNSSPHCTTRRGGTVARMAPATGMASTEPSAGPSRVSPRTPGDRPSAVLIAGIRAAQVPEDSPSTPKTMVTGARAARLAHRSAMPRRQGAAQPQAGDGLDHRHQECHCDRHRRGRGQADQGRDGPAHRHLGQPVAQG